MLTDGQWSGEAAYIIGGGPSLKDFPWSLLRDPPHKGRIIAINAAMFDVPWADVFFTEDFQFIEKFSGYQGWKDFQGTKVFHALLGDHGTHALALEPTLQVIPCKRKDKFWSRSLEEGLSWSSNSGVGAINLACILGADPIYLLGFDCRPRQLGENPNYHNKYPADWRMPIGQELQYKSDFEHWAAHWTRDRRVVNLTSRGEPSAIICWPRYDRDLVLELGIEDAQSLIAMPRIGA